MAYAQDSFIAEAAHHNWHGWTMGDLVCLYQDDADRIEDIKAIGCGAINFQRPSECPDEEWINNHIFFHTERMRSITAEIERRDTLTNRPAQVNDQPLIQTIKERLSIEDVLGWYTEVINEKSQWKYRCTLHGADKHPSGVIYRDEKRCWCFACQQGGDVIDIVRLFERLDLREAIAKLAKHLGLNTKPIIVQRGGYSTGIERTE